MKNLEKIRDLLLSRKDLFVGDYFIPACWNRIGYTDYKTQAEHPGEISVNPYAFYTACIDSVLQNATGLKQAGPIQENLIYSIFPRSCTAWAHTSKTVQPGTLLKTLALLPLLKQIGVSILYLLPVFCISDHYKKGEFGSPYAIRDFYKIDGGLHDPLLGNFEEALLETEFKALTESCHALGIRVVVDFVFRTAARDNVLIAEHPDWFYWIKKEAAADFKRPTLGDGKKACGVNDKNARRLYRSPGLAQYLSQFSLSPDLLDREKWERLKDGGIINMDRKIEDAFGVTTVPGFPDVINDPQPAWTDVTYLRYYFDNPPEAQHHLPPDQPPYIMQDGASLSHSHGTKKNGELWQYITDILPFYKTRFGIDGARIDMAHALPDELNAQIIAKIKEVDPEFILWSEELDPEKSGQAKVSGFDFISGFTYAEYKKGNSGRFNTAIIGHLQKSEIPVAASLETPDTPRSALLYPNRSFLRLLIFINNFLPNAVPMLNSGQELFEIQPMNLGLDNDENGRFVLPESDPMYGRLAFFDRCCLHWADADPASFAYLATLSQIRGRYSDYLAHGKWIAHPEFARAKKITVLHYQKHNASLVAAANRSPTTRAVLSLARLLGQEAPRECRVVYDSGGNHDIDSLTLLLHPLETILLEIKEKYKGESQ